MSTTVHLVTHHLYREPLRRKLLESGFATQVFRIKEPNVNFHQPSNQMFIVQAHMWPRFRYTLNDSTSVVMFGTSSWFYCWFKAMLKHTSAYMTPHDSLDVIDLSLKQVLQGNHYLSDTMKKLLNKDKKKMQEQLLEEDLSSHLTQSELEVLVLIGEKCTTAEIAENRFRSVHTVKTQRKKIRRKINAINGERLAVFAGRKIYALKTLLLIEKHTELLDEICKNTS